MTARKPSKTIIRGWAFSRALSTSADGARVIGFFRYRRHAVDTANLYLRIKIVPATLTLERGKGKKVKK